MDLGRLAGAFRFENAVGGVEREAELRFGLERRSEVVRMLEEEHSAAAAAAVAIAAGMGCLKMVVEQSIAVVELAAVRSAVGLHSPDSAEELMVLSVVPSISPLEVLGAVLTREELGLF